MKIDGASLTKVVRVAVALATAVAAVACLGIHLRSRAMAMAVIPIRADSVAKREGFGVQCKVEKKWERALASGPGEMWGLVGGAWQRLPEYRQTESKVDVVERLDFAWRPQGRFVWLGGKAAKPFQDAPEYQLLIYDTWKTVWWHVLLLGGGLALGWRRLQCLLETSTVPSRLVAWLEAT
ncbi:MAG: hypothetical protein ACOYMN_14375 [Roseimicrobium sp.]